MLVSQIERSGGTLLSRLFDGHPECHAHPRELEIGYPNQKRHWPPIDLDRPESWFEMLHEAHLGKYRRKGYWSSKRAAERIPFLFSMQLQRTIFDTCVATRNMRSERDVLDCYFTSYFNAWLDNHNLYTGPKKVVTGFVPRLSLEPRRGRAILRRLSGRDAHHHRDGIPAAGTLSFRATPRRATTTSRVRWGCGVGRPRSPSRRTSDAPSASSSSCTRPSCATPRPRCDASPIESGSPCPPRSSSPPSTVGRSRPTRASKVTGQGVLPERAEAWRESLDQATTTRIESPLRRPVRARAEHCAVIGRREDPHRSRRKAVLGTTLPAADAAPRSLVGQGGRRRCRSTSSSSARRPLLSRSGCAKLGAAVVPCSAHPLSGVSPGRTSSSPSGAQRRPGSPRRQRCVLPRGRLRASRSQAPYDDLRPCARQRRAVGAHPPGHRTRADQAGLGLAPGGVEGQAPGTASRRWSDACISPPESPGFGTRPSSSRSGPTGSTRSRRRSRDIRSSSFRSTAATRWDSPWRSRSTEASTCSRPPITTGRCVFASAWRTRRSCTWASSGP